jgi:hypothetical protein
MEAGGHLFENFKLVLFFKAALWDNAELLEDLLKEEGHLVNCLDSWGRTPLHAAAISDSKCLDLLIFLAWQHCHGKIKKIRSANFPRIYPKLK